MEQRWADNQLDRLPALATDLVRRNAAVIVLNTPGLEVARAASPTVPIVFVVGDDPVKMGFVGSLNRPEGNLTGVTFFGGSMLAAKRLEMLHELVPNITLVAVLIDPNYPAFEAELPNIEMAARVLGLQTVLVKAASDLDAAFALIVETGAGAVLFGGGPVLRSQLQHVVALAARHAIPVIYELRDYVEAGGLISYAASFPGAYRQAGMLGCSCGGRAVGYEHIAVELHQFGCHLGEVVVSALGPPILDHKVLALLISELAKPR